MSFVTVVDLQFAIEHARDKGGILVNLLGGYPLVLAFSPRRRIRRVRVLRRWRLCVSRGYVGGKALDGKYSGVGGYVGAI